MRLSTLPCLFALLCAGELAAQGCYFAPSDTPSTGTCNVFPWGQSSSRYQSLFTAQDLGNSVRRLSEISFAPCGGGTFSAQSITIQFAYFTGSTLSTNFVNNLGTSPTVMLQKTNFSFQKNANAWSDVGLTNMFIYIPARGNLLVDIVFQGGSGGSSFHRDTRQRVYANNWSTTPPATGSSDNGALKMRVCEPPLCGNRANATVFGAGCKGNSTSVPAVSSPNQPILGQGFSVDLTAAPSSRPVAFSVGASNTTWGAIPLPFDLTPLGAPGCNLLVSPDLLIPLVTSGTGTATLNVPLPASSVFCNAHLYFQCIVYEPSANKLLWIFSNGLDAHLGS